MTDLEYEQYVYDKAHPDRSGEFKIELLMLLCFVFLVCVLGL